MILRSSLKEKAEGAVDGATTLHPEKDESKLRDPGLTDLSGKDWLAAAARAGKKLFTEHITDTAAALAYYAFLAIPAAMLTAVGLFSLFASPRAVETLMTRLEGVVPEQTIDLLQDSLTRAIQNRGGGLAMVLVGLLVALWTLTGATNALMRGLNKAFDRDETRGFLKQRLTALGILVCVLFAFVLVFGLLVLGPALARWLGNALGMEGSFHWIWWTAQWPILVLGLLLAFSAVFYLGPDLDQPKWKVPTVGAVSAVVIWLTVSGVFAVYVGMFGSYNKAWGSLAAVIIMLTWLWLSALALLFGAALNSEVERSRRRRTGTVKGRLAGGRRLTGGDPRSNPA